jgi:hypothetical protein
MHIQTLFFLGNVKTVKYYANTITNEGICKTFNPIEAKLIFRNDTVDPVFFTQYQFNAFGIKPQYWSMEDGYTPGKIDNYPYRAFDKGQNNGLNIYICEKFQKYIAQLRQCLSHKSTEFEDRFTSPC